MHWVRNTLIFIIVLVLAAAAFFVFSFNPNTYRQQITELAAQRGWQIHYQDSQWSLANPMRWQFDDLTLTHSDVLQLQAQQLTFHLDFDQLLHGKLIIRTGQLSHAKIQLKTGKIPSPTHFTLLPIEIAQLQLSNSSLDWSGSASFPAGHLTSADLNLEHSPSLWVLRGYAEQAQVGAYEGSHVNFTLSRTPSNWQIKQLQFDQAEGEIQAQGNYQNQHLHLSQLTLKGNRFQQMSFDKLAHMNWPQWLSQLDIDTINWQRLNLRIPDPQTPVVLNNLSGNLSDFHWQRDHLQVLSGNFHININNALIKNVPMEHLRLDGALNGEMLRVSQLQGQLQPGEFSSAFNYRLTKAPLLTVISLTLKHAVLAIPEQGIPQGAEPVWPWPLSITVEQADCQQCKLLSYDPTLALSLRQFDAQVANIQLFDDGKLAPLNSMLTAQSSVYWSAPSVAYRGLIVEQMSAQLGSNPSSSSSQFQVYGEFPEGQFQWKGTLDFKQQPTRWNSQISGLMLDFSPLQPLLGPHLKIAGDLSLTGTVEGQLGQPWWQWQGQLTTTSHQLAINRAIDPLIPPLLGSQRSTLTAHQSLLNLSLAQWLKRKTDEKGQTVFEKAHQQVTLADGQWVFKKSVWPSANYTYHLTGMIDSRHQRYHQLKLSVKKDGCSILTRSLDGPWNAAQLRIDQYQLKQSYLPHQQQFIPRQISMSCPPKPQAPPATAAP